VAQKPYSPSMIQENCSSPVKICSLPTEIPKIHPTWLKSRMCYC